MLYIISYLCIGVIAGTLSGLLGVGGGTVIVPSLALVFLHLSNIPHNDVFHFAVGTSLASIVFTSATGAMVHVREKNVDISLAKRLLPGLLVGVILGVIIASHLPGDWLKKLFALFLLYSSARLFFALQLQADANSLSRKRIWGTTAMIGAASSLFGIGIGGLTVPFLIRHRIRIHQASAIALVCTVPIALCGSMGFIISAHKNVYVAHALGYIYLPALLFVSVASISCTRIGIRLAKKTNRQLLQRIFAAFLLLVSISLFI